MHLWSLICFSSLVQLVGYSSSKTTLQIYDYKKRKKWISKCMFRLKVCPRSENIENYFINDPESIVEKEQESVFLLIIELMWMLWTWCQRKQCVGCLLSRSQSQEELGYLYITSSLTVIILSEEESYAVVFINCVHITDICFSFLHSPCRKYLMFLWI